MLLIKEIEFGILLLTSMIISYYVAQLVSSLLLFLFP